MFDFLKNEIHQSLDELFATAAVDELTGDTKAQKAKYVIISRVADALGIETEITTVTLDLKHGNR
jgi:hypothetical protein